MNRPARTGMMDAMVLRSVGGTVNTEGRTTESGASRRSRAMLATGVVATVALAAAGFALGRDATASRPHEHSGEAWLSTKADGTVNLVDGISGGSAAKGAGPGSPGHAVAATQNGAPVFVR